MIYQQACHMKSLLDILLHLRENLYHYLNVFFPWVRSHYTTTLIVIAVAKFKRVLYYCTILLFYINFNFSWLNFLTFLILLVALNEWRIYLLISGTPLFWEIYTIEHIAHYRYQKIPNYAYLRIYICNKILSTYACR